MLRLKPKYFKAWVLCFSLVSVIFINGCGDDDDSGSVDDPEVDPIVGPYTLESVVLTSDFAIDGTVILPTGTNLTSEISAALFDASPCSENQTTVVNLTDDPGTSKNGDLDLTCVEDSSIAAEDTGDWLINGDRDELTLDIIVLGIPFSVVLTIDTPLPTTGEIDTITGNVEGLPIPGSFFDPTSTETFLLDVEMVFDSVD